MHLPGLDLGSGFVKFLLSFAVTAKHRPPQYNFFLRRPNPSLSDGFCGEQKRGRRESVQLPELWEILLRRRL